VLELETVAYTLWLTNAVMKPLKLKRRKHHDGISYFKIGCIEGYANAKSQSFVAQTFRI